MSDMKLGLQMWSIHDVCIEKGMPEALCLIREMGYEGFEFALGDCATLEERCGAKPAEVKKALQEYGVKAIGSHISFERLLEDPDPVLKDCVEYEVPYAAIAPIFTETGHPLKNSAGFIRKQYAFPVCLRKTGYSFRYIAPHSVS